MRIIAGEYKGRQLKCLDGEEIRPTLDKVKEAVFSILQWRIADARFVDLFSGCGGIGLEALSRGAGKVYFSESSGKAMRVIKENFAALKVEKAPCEFLMGDYKRNLERIGEGGADIIYADPPYFAKEIYETLPLAVLGALSTGGLLVIEYSCDFTLSTDCYEIIAEKKYGTVRVLVLKKM